MDTNVISISEDKAAEVLRITAVLAEVLRCVATGTPERRPPAPETGGPAPLVLMRKGAA